MNFLEKNPCLNVREFYYYLSLRFGVIFALNMQSTLLFYWIYAVTGSKLALGMIGLAEVIPALLFALWAGHVVDLREKRGLVMRCVLGYLVIGLGLALLTRSDSIEAWGMTPVLVMVFALFFGNGLLRPFYGPSSFALFGLILPREYYANGTSWSSMAWQLGAVLGPLVGGILLATLGVSHSMWAVVAVELLLLIPLFKIGVKPIIKTVREPVWESITGGLRFVLKTPSLLGAQLLDMFSVLFGGAVALLPVFQKEILLVDETGFGILRAAPGIGAIVTLIVLGFVPLKTNPGKKLFIVVTGFALCIIGFGLSEIFWLSFAFLVFSGMFDAISVVIRGTILQLVTPDEMRGRVASVNTMFISSSNELGDFESGVMAHTFGAQRAVVIGGMLTLGVVGATYVWAKDLRKFQFYPTTKQLNSP